MKTTQEVVQKRRAAMKSCPNCQHSVANRTIQCPNCNYDYLRKSIPLVAKTIPAPVKPKGRPVAARIKETPKMPEMIPADFLTVNLNDMPRLRESMAKFPRNFYEKGLEVVEAEKRVELLKLELCELEVKTDAEYRVVFTAEKGKAPTEKLVENYVDTNEEVLDKRRELIEARAELKRAARFADSTEYLGKVMLGLVG